MLDFSKSITIAQIIYMTDGGGGGMGTARANRFMLLKDSDEIELRSS